MPALTSYSPTARWQSAAARVLQESRKYTIRTYWSPSSLPSDVWDCLESSPRNSNILYPHLLKCLQDERNGIDVRGEFWMVYRSTSLIIDFILSCANGPLGTYPLFIYTPHPFEALLDDVFVRTPMARIVRELRQHVSPHRIYSVFGPEPVAKTFATLWTIQTGITIEEEPYYAALITYCTRSTLIRRSMTLHPDFDYELRLAEEGDIHAVAELCHEFASSAEPFTLTPERALAEAEILVHHRQLWVHLVGLRGSPEKEIASIVAVTRTSRSVSAITKVFTNPAWRKRGCAERLVRHVCNNLLREKESVVLYVAHNNPAASKVYARVGFVGLNDHNCGAEGVDPWIEIGFDRSLTQLGHW